LHPSIVHTRNIATLDHQFTAFLARVPCRIHGEHGWDLFDLQGQSSKYRYLRRLSQSVVHGFIAVSKHMDLWLTQSVGINSAKVMQIYNGVDTDRFRPRKAHEQRQITTGFAEETDFVIGTVGRLEPVKNQLMLLKAFIAARNTGRSSRALKLVVVGDGSQYPDIQDLVREHELQEHVWMPGARDDIPDIMQCLDLFVLPSKNEGISNTILEAMASGLPIVATDVGGNGELVENGKTGKLVALDDVSGLADAIIAYANDADATHNQARAARDTVEKDYSISRMVNDYVRLYDRMLSSVNFTRGYRSCVE
ncbi:MAG: glycosyltransferase, partial [Gammaproteobacteria bacterium]|nr:glycosyltransferase [Gammaproteobacteria bacterium]